LEGISTLAVTSLVAEDAISTHAKASLDALEPVSRLARAICERRSAPTRGWRSTWALQASPAAERVEMHRRRWRKIGAAEANATLNTVERLDRVLGVDGGEMLGAWPTPAPRARSI
jgi:hypothetical protein